MALYDTQGNLESFDLARRRSPYASDFNERSVEPTPPQPEPDLAPPRMPTFAPAPAPAPFHGGLTPTTPFTGNTNQRSYRGADGTLWADDPNPNSVTGFIQSRASGPQNGDYRSWFMGLTNGKAPTPQELTALGPTLQQYGVSLAPNAAGVNGKIRLPSGEVIDVIQGADRGGQAWQWLDNAWYQQNARGAGGGGGVGGGGYAATNPFDDPATKSYIDLLNKRILDLQKPQQNPELDRLMGYLTKHFEQLQQPVYSDAQRDVLNTQTIDPLERQRTARKQQVLQQLAARGLSPGDGPSIQALQNVDREFDQMRAQYQGSAAANEIGLGRENQRQAVDIASLAAQMRNGQFQQDESRQNQAVGYGRQIPDMARQRLQDAIALLNGNQLNPNTLINSMNNWQMNDRYQGQQDSQYWAGIMAQLAKIFGL